MQTFYQKLTRLFMRTLITIGFATCFFALGVSANASLVAKSYAAGFAKGKSTPLDASRMKLMLRENPEAAKAMGKMWWFGMDHKDRKLR